LIVAITKSLLNELLELSPEERIQLAEDLWDSIGHEEMPAPTEAQIREAERRYADHLRHPEKASRWEDVKARLLARYR
jgi:putative addiction module component (TIGR02574 family)